MRKFSKKQYLIAGVAAVAIAGAAGGAYAYWTNSGDGTGTASTGTSSSFVVTVDSVDLQDLTPGGPSDTIDYHIHNQDTGSEYVTSATPTVTSTSDSGCTSADFSITGNTFSAGQLAAGATGDYSFQLQMVNSSSNQDACKGVTVNLDVAVA